MATEIRSPNAGSGNKKKKIGTIIPLHPDQLEDLRCVTCTKYLSNPPIMLGENGNYCGDCGDYSDEELIRNVDFEKLAACFEFPCSYEGCEKKLPFERIGQHQKNCNIRSYECPFPCPWKGVLKKLEQHILSQHKSQVLMNGTFNLKYNEGYINTGMLIIEDRYFLVEIEFDDIIREFVFTVEHVGSPAAAGMFKYYLQMVGNKIAKHFCTESKSILPKTTQKIEDKHKTRVTINDLLAYLKYPTSIECRVFVYNKADFADHTRSTSLQNAGTSSNIGTDIDAVMRVLNDYLVVK